MYLQQAGLSITRTRGWDKIAGVEWEIFRSEALAGDGGL
jgi:hypothetical protein